MPSHTIRVIAGGDAAAALAPRAGARVLASRDGDALLLTCEGELCLSTRGDVWRVIERALDPAPARVRLDLRRVSFADSRAVWVVLATASRCRRTGAELELLVGDRLARLFSLVGVPESGDALPALRRAGGYAGASPGRSE